MGVIEGECPGMIEAGDGGMVPDLESDDPGPKRESGAGDAGQRKPREGGPGLGLRRFCLGFQSSILASGAERLQPGAASYNHLHGIDVGNPGFSGA